MNPATVLSIDPGRMKCGVAIVSVNRPIRREIIPSDSFIPLVVQMLDEHSIDVILIGNGTGSDELRKSVEAAARGIRVIVVEESHSSERARIRYFKENPPRGIKRLIPRGLLFPDAPYDDLVAVILAEDFFKSLNG
jgi:RNase H-fold protein (predicted Holliday junction resolvase)